MSLEGHEAALTTCTYCPSLCRHTCPVGLAEGREAVTPQAKMAMLGRLRRGDERWSAESASVLYACNGCGLCTRACVHEVDVASALALGRAAAVDEGAGHAVLPDLGRRFHLRARRTRETLAARFARRCAEAGATAFFPGCAVGRDAGASTARALAVFRRFGLGNVAVADLPFASAGYALWAGGHSGELGRVAERTRAAVDRFGELITDCAACVWMLRDTYPSLGFRPAARVRHVSEVLCDRLDGVRLAPRRGRALYQEACLLGRHLGVREPPRRLASACVEQLIESPAGAERSPCSGGGGLVPLTAPGTAAATAARRIDEAREVGVSLVVTPCPTARRTLAPVSGRVRVVDLLELLAAALKPV
jgi:Fe-S oxidoreductase